MKRFITGEFESGSMEPMTTKRRARRLADVTGDYALEVGMGVWAALVGFVSLIWDPPSSSLAQLPPALDTTWAIVMLAGAVGVAYGLRVRHSSPAIANAMLLFATAFAVYSITAISIGGWANSGAVGGLTSILAIVCYLRSRRLRELWRILAGEGERLRANGRSES